MKTKTLPRIILAALCCVAVVILNSCHDGNLPVNPVESALRGENAAQGLETMLGEAQIPFASLCGTAQSVTLYAGQTITAGTVTVFNTSDSAYIVISTTPPWTLRQTHLYVGELSLVPSTPTGNPKIGNFPYRISHTSATMTVRYAVALASLPPCFIVAAHADVAKLDPQSGKVLQTQTAWGAGTRFTPKGSWATYFGYCKQECSKPSCRYETKEFDYFGGQTILVGKLLVTNDERNLYVHYSTTGDWYLGYTHLYVGAPSGLPITRDSIPIPGRFPYTQGYSSATQSYTYTIPLDSLPDCFIIAAHAELQKIIGGQITQTETGWSYGAPFPNSPRWGWYSDYCAQRCVKP